jgi:hypothetical protein
MTAEEPKRLKAIHQVVHEYANFVSSAEMVLTGKDIYGDYFKSPINTHVSHAFYLNCRKQADFFQNKESRERDNVMAAHFVPGYTTTLAVSEDWRGPINKQLAHTTYARDESPREINAPAEEALYKELKETWRTFRDQLPEPYRSEFIKKVRERKEPYPDGKLSEFRFYDLD